MEIVYLYKSLIDIIVERSGSAELLHVHAGMAIYLLTLMAVRQRRGGLLALQAVLAAELANEAMDWLAAGPRWTWEDTISDFVLTLMWPAAITVVIAWRRRRRRKAVDTMPRPAAAPSPSSRHAPVAST